QNCFTCFPHCGDVLLKPLRGGNRAKLPPIGHDNWRCGAADCRYSVDVLDPGGAAHVLTGTEETDHRVGGSDVVAGKGAQSDVREAAGVVSHRLSTDSDITAAAGIVGKRIQTNSDIQGAESVAGKREKTHGRVAVSRCVAFECVTADGSVAVGKGAD